VNGEAVSVSRLNRLAREAIEGSLPLMWISGEISNLVRAASGHVYFTLKDDRAQVRCTLWRNRAQLLPFRLEHGQEVEVRALPSLYEARGEFQLNVETVRKAGVGSLFEAFLRLREQLQAEGLFEAALKRPLPRYPRAVGIVTSRQAAALRDVLAALRRRAVGVPVVLYPAPVQGEDAPGRLVEAIDTAAARQPTDCIDVLLLVRGGGSMEDLWAFNDAALARAIRASPIPVVCGVGHENDFTIADFAADLRAATPTAAAELASAGYAELGPVLEAQRRALDRAALRMVERASQRLDRAQVRLLHPAQRLSAARERVEQLRRRLDAQLRADRLRARNALETLAWRLRSRSPDVSAPRTNLALLAGRLGSATARRLDGDGRRLDALENALSLLDPRRVMARGYGIVRDREGRILRDAGATMVGDEISVTLARGMLDAVVRRVPEAPPGPDFDDLSARHNPD